jgi:hypothetical protein
MLRAPWTRALVATAILSLAPFALPTTASAGSAHGTGIGLPTEAVVGTTVHATIVITNASTTPENASTHTISDMLLIPSCGASGPDGQGDCPTPDIGAVVPASNGVGQAGTACAGFTFSITPQAGSTTGRYQVTPSAPVVLAPPAPGDSDRCTIALDLTIARSPSHDALASPGLQTVAIASSVGTSNIAPPGQPNSTSFSAGAAAITVTPAVPVLSTQVVEPEVALGETVADAATLSGGADPTGTLAFDLYGPDDADCSETPVAHAVHAVDGTGTYASAPTAPAEPGGYRFVARYSGDADNQAISGTCNDPNESVVVTAAEPPGIRVVKVATPLSRPEPGGTFSFSVSVTNTSAVPLTLTGLHDDIYGDVATQGTCTSAVGTVLQPGDAYSCAFPGGLTGNAGATQTDVVTVTAVDGAGTAVTDDDDAVVSLTDVPPTVTVAKTALPEERVAPGGLFTFGLVITNTSGEAVTITELEDDVYGDLSRLTSSTCATAIGTTLAPGAQLSCTFTGELTGAVGAAQTDVVTVTVTDDDHSTGTAKDDATIRLVAPGATTTTSPVTTTTLRPTTPTTRPPTTPGTPSLARTGRNLRQQTLQALTLLGIGLLLTGISWSRTNRRRSPSSG